MHFINGAAMLKRVTVPTIVQKAMKTSGVQMGKGTYCLYAPHHEEVWGSGIIAPHTFNHGTRGTGVDSFTPRQHYRRG